MTGTPALVLHPRYDEDSQLLWQAAISRGWQTLRITYDVAEHAKLQPTALFHPAGDLEQAVIYGGYMWAETIAAELGVTLLSPSDDWLVKLDPKWTRRKIWLSTVGKVCSSSRCAASSSTRASTIIATICPTWVTTSRSSCRNLCVGTSSTGASYRGAASRRTRDMPRGASWTRIVMRGRTRLSRPYLSS